MTFQQQLLLILVDKLAIGLLLALAGFLFSKILERFKTRQAFQNEIAKQRVSKISEVWAAIYSWEALVSQIVYDTSDLQIRYKQDPANLEAALESEIEPLHDKANQRSQVIHELAEVNRFWLGEDLYQRFRHYSNNLIDYLNAFFDKDLRKVQELKSQREKMKQDVFHFFTTPS